MAKPDTIVTTPSHGNHRPKFSNELAKSIEVNRVGFKKLLNYLFMTKVRHVLHSPKSEMHATCSMTLRLSFVNPSLSALACLPDETVRLAAVPELE